MAWRRWPRWPGRSRPFSARPLARRSHDSTIDGRGLASIVRASRGQGFTLKGSPVVAFSRCTK
jgi:hypothetical protein